MDLDQLRALLDDAVNSAPRGEEVGATDIVRTAKHKQRARRSAAGVLAVLLCAGLVAAFASRATSSAGRPAGRVRIVPPPTPPITIVGVVASE